MPRPNSLPARLHRWTLPLALAWLAGLPVQAQPIDARREAQLVRMVRQDCGSCHGMALTGGLGPALTREALGEKPAEFLAVAIYHGRPGTPMPPWRSMLSMDEARWISERLLGGFPKE